MTINRDELRRGCFLLHVRKDMVEQFREAHRNVWPELALCGRLGDFGGCG